MPKISVIVPVYKVEAYLDRCVKSILAQTFEDFELILVEDGSPDNCGAMCDAWAEKDSRIKVIHKENGGLSDARNAGFEVSAGEWITFIDSDDYVHPAMLQALLEAAESYGTDISACGFCPVHGQALVLLEDPQGKRLSPRVFYREYVYATMAWAKLYARGCFDTIRYPKGKLHEDEYVTYRILFGCESIAVVDTPLYGYFQNGQSIMRSRWNPKRLDALPAFEEQISFFAQRGEEELRRWRIWEYMMYVIAQLDSLDGGFEKEKAFLEDTGRRLLRRYRRDKIFDGEKHQWIYARFYPRRTKLKSLWLAVLKKGKEVAS